MNEKNTDNEVHVEDSSLVNVNTGFYIDQIKRTASNVLTVQLKAGPSFFIRDFYLPLEYMRLLNSGAWLSLTQLDNLLHFAKITEAEKIARSYIQRAEHTKSQLSIKLQKKQFSMQEIKPALDYLESLSIIDDARFAGAWLRNRAIHRKEGKIKLLALLIQRGVDKKIAETVLHNYFEVANEAELCKECIKKAKQRGKTDKKLLSYVIQKGYSLSMIRTCLKEEQL